MSDDISSLPSRIAALAESENRMNRDRKNAVAIKQARRDGEKRTEDANLATLEREKQRQTDANTTKERKFQSDLKREGEELDHVSKKIRDEFNAETRHREAAKQHLQAELAAREAKLRSINSSRP